MPTFDARVDEMGRGGRAVVVPLDVPALFGKVRAPVRGTVNGFPYRSTIMRYGDTYYLGLNREVRHGAGIDAGHVVTVELELDDAPREVEVPEELAAVLEAAPAARRAFDALSYTHRREYAGWVGEGKRDETRRTRAQKAIAMLTKGARTPY
jgi:bacteriocin resistance YdeI/OmpD-like protein/uncharacterized protein DUF1905